MNEHKGHRSWRHGIALMLWMCTLACGCASLPRPPAGLDLGRAAIVLDPVDPRVVVDGPAGKLAGAAGGAATGSGVGLAVGLLSAGACIGAGPLAPMCIATLVPTSIAVGAVGGAAVGAIRAEGSDAVETKHRTLADALATTSYRDLLAGQLQQVARERLAVELALLNDRSATVRAGAGPDSADREAVQWLIELSLIEVATGRASADEPFPLRVEGRIRVRRVGDTRVDYEASHEVVSAASVTAAQWNADAAEALRSGLRLSLRLLADKMLSDLARAPGVARRESSAALIPRAQGDLK